MKSRTSFFDKTVLKKDLLRFSPLWALYLIGGLLIMHILSGFYGNYYHNRAYSIARDLNAIIGPLGILSACYGFLSAQLLFGDLHNTRLCYGVHAFPLRREGWYLTHSVSGLIMGLVPPMVILLTLMPMMGSFWFTALLCFAAVALHYLFFFALSVFSMMVTGSRFAAAAVYGIVNFLSLIVHWFTKTIYIPLLPGVRANTGVFDLFSPMVELVGRHDFFRIEHLDTCAQCRKATIYPDYYGGSHDYGYLGLGGDWGYLWVLAGIGILLLILGLLLYRIRHLERAGDFIAFRPMKPIFLWVYTLCVGGVLFYLANETSGTAAGYVFLVIGILIGYFTGKMLLERTIRVFKGKSWAGLGILYAAVALSLLLTWADPIGISHRIPKAEKVDVVYLYDGRLSDYQLNNADRIATYQEVIAVTAPEDIAAVRQAHSLMLDEHQTDNHDDSRWFTLQYKLKSGATVSRTYRIYSYGEAREALKPYLTKPAYLFGVDDLEQLLQRTSSIYSSELGEIPEVLWPELLKAMWLDAQKGHLSTNGSTVTGKNVMYMELRVANQYRALHFSEAAPYLNQWLKQHRNSPQLILKYDTLEALIADTYSIHILDSDWKLSKVDHREFLDLLWQDCLNGDAKIFGKWSSGINIELQTAHEYQSLALSSDSRCAQWIIAHTGK